MPASFGERVARAREVLGLTIPDVAEKAGIPQGTLSSIEARGQKRRKKRLETPAPDPEQTNRRGRKPGPKNPVDLDILTALAKTLRVPVVYLVTVDAPAYLSAYWYEMAKSGRADLIALPPHRRAARLIEQLEKLFDKEEWSKEDLARRLGWQIVELEKFLSGAFEPNAEQWEAFVEQIGAPREVFEAMSLDLNPVIARAYTRVIQAAVAMDVSPRELAGLVARHDVERATGQTLT